MYKNYCVSGNTCEQPFDRMTRSASEFKSISKAKQFKKYLIESLGLQAYVCRAYYDKDGHLLGWKEWIK